MTHARLVLRERHVALDARTTLRLELDQDGVALYVEAANRPREPVLRLPPEALREVARALALFAGELGVR